MNVLTGGRKARRRHGRMLQAWLLALGAGTFAAAVAALIRL